MREVGKPDLKSIFAKAGEIVGAKVREGSGALPVATVDGQESPKSVVPTAEAKAGAIPASSAEKEESALQIFVKSVPDRGKFSLTSEKGKDYEYKKDGSKLLRQKKKGGPWEDATEEAFKRQKKGWKLTIAPTESSAVSTEDSAQPTGEPALTSAGTSNDQAKNLAKPEASAESGVAPTVAGAQAEGSQLEESKAFKAFREKLAPLIFDVFPKRLEEIDNLTVLNTLRSEERPHIEVIRHNWQSEIGFVYKCLSPEDQKRANVYIKQENRICLDAIEKKEDILIKNAKRQWYAIAENELPFQKAVAEKAKMIAGTITAARGLKELKNIGQERFVKINGEKRKERRFFSVGMFFSKYENDPTMIRVLNSIADQKDSPAEKELSSLWEGKLRSLEEELAPGAKIINDQLSAVISEKRALLQSLTSENKVSKQSEIYFSRLFEDLEATAVDFFKDFDSEGLRSVLVTAKKTELKPEDIKQQKPKKDARPVAPEKRKEYSYEELFAILVEALRNNRKSFGKDKNGKKLLIERKNIFNTEIIYSYGGQMVSMKPKNVEKFLQFLEANFSWTPGALQEKRAVSPEEVEARGIMKQVDDVIQKKRGLAKDILEHSMNVEKVSEEGYGNFLEYLDDLGHGAKHFFEERDIKGLQSILEKANQAEFKLEVPVESAPEELVQTEEEKTYEELEDLLDPAEQWSISGIVGDALGTVLIYSRKKGKLKGNIIDEMGGMDFVAEKILMPAIQKVLPSKWSEDDKKFYSRESALDYLDLFVEEDEEETKK